MAAAEKAYRENGQGGTVTVNRVPLDGGGSIDLTALGLAGFSYLPRTDRPSISKAATQTLDRAGRPAEGVTTPIYPSARRTIANPAIR